MSDYISINSSILRNIHFGKLYFFMKFFRWIVDMSHWITYDYNHERGEYMEIVIGNRNDLNGIIELYKQLSDTNNTFFNLYCLYWNVFL